MKSENSTKMTGKETPPRWAVSLLRSMADPKTLEEVEGDLLEMYAHWSNRVGAAKARNWYVLNVLKLLRPFAKRKNQYPQTYLFSHQMIRNYLKIATKNLKSNKAYTLINVAGLALGMGCAVLIFILVKYHISIDNFHANADRIYRIVTEQHRDNISYQRSVPAPLGKVFKNDYTFGEKVARIATFEQAPITLKEGKELRKFKDEIAFTEPEFFEIFNYPLLEGDKVSALNAPGTAVITQKMAQKYFAGQNPIGKSFWLDNKIGFTITGILKDLPENTDRKTGIYVSYASLRSFNEWLASDDSWGGIQDAMQCYVLLRPGISIAQVEKVFPAYVSKYRPNSKNVHHYKLQPLAQVHFDSRYDGQMEKRNLWILSVIGIFLIASACVNFINLATAQAFKDQRKSASEKFWED